MKAHLKNIFYAVIIAVYIYGCGSSQDGQKRHTETARLEGELKQGDGNTGGGTTPDGGGGGDGGSGSTPNYLFSLEEAQNIGDLVLAYSPASGSSADIDTHDSQYDDFKSVIDNFLAAGDSVTELSPWRDFDVRATLGQAVLNAYAANDILVFWEPVFELQFEAMLFVVCHEAGHSAQNHSKELAELNTEMTTKQDSAEGKALSKALDDYVAEHFDEANKTYNHKSAEYDAILKMWEDYWIDNWNVKRRNESEADIIGGHICNHLGLSNDELKAAVSSVMGALPGSEGSALPDGEYPYDGTPEEFMVSILPQRTHPTPSERQSQFDDVNSIFTIGDSGDLSTLASSYQSAKSASGLAFTAASIPYQTLRSLDGTIEVRLPRPDQHRSCSHGSSAEKDFIEAATRR